MSQTSDDPPFNLPPECPLLDRRQVRDWRQRTCFFATSGGDPIPRLACGAGLLGEGGCLATDAAHVYYLHRPCHDAITALLCSSSTPDSPLFCPLPPPLPKKPNSTQSEKPRGPAQSGYQAWVNNPTNLSADVLEGCCGRGGSGWVDSSEPTWLLGGPRVGATGGG